MLQELIDFLIIDWVDGNTDTDPNQRPVLPNVERLRQELGDSLCDKRDIFFAREAFKDNRELISSHTRDCVYFAHTLLKSFRDGLQKLITDIVTHGIVHRFEWIEIE